MRALLAPACGVVHEACTELLHRCTCWSGMQLTKQHQLPGPCSSSSSTLQQHTAQLQQQRGKHTVRMVLLKDHEHLGSRGDIVEVKAGHARQTLFPKGEADYAVPSVLRQLQAQGLLSAQAQQVLSGTRSKAASSATDPSQLPLEQQLPLAIKALSSRPLVVSRRFSHKGPDQPMVGAVTARQLCLYAARQLHVELPRQLLMMGDNDTITQFGSYTVPLNLKDEQGQQVELAVQVNKTYRAPGLRRLKLWGQAEGLLPRSSTAPGKGQRRTRKQQQQQQQQQQEGAEGTPQSLVQPESPQQPSTSA